MKKFSLILLIALLAVGCKNIYKDAPENQFAGLWKLVVLEQKDPETGKWELYRDGLQGYILYDGKENMAVHLTSRGYQNTDIIFHDFIDTVSMEELKHRTQSYVYFAKYKIFQSENIVEHARISHSNPNLWNTTVQRHYKFSGDTLILKTVENKNYPLRVKWIKHK
jgi:hypothetical protein